MKRYELTYMMPSTIAKDEWDQQSIEVLTPQSTLDYMQRGTNAMYGLFYCGDSQELYVPFSNVVRLKQVYE